MVTDAPVTSSQWFYLSDLHPIDSSTSTNCTGGCTGEQPASATIGGTVYSQSRTMRIAASGSEAKTTWNASKHCTRLKATVGLTDNSPTATAQFQAAIDDGTPIDLATVTTGQSQQIDLDLTGAFRFELDAHLTKALPYGTFGQQIAWGDARMLCSATP